MQRKWKKQTASNVNIILPLKYAFCPHAHALCLTKTKDKGAGLGRWLSRRKMNDFHISYLFHFPIHAIFLYLSNIHGHSKTQITSYFFLLQSLAIFSLFQVPIAFLI